MNTTTSFDFYLVMAAVAFLVALLSVIVQWVRTDHEIAKMVLNSEQVAEDETTLARLCLGWGAVGLAVGMGAAGAVYGAVGALLGGVVGSFVTVMMVTTVVVALDKTRLRNTVHVPEAKKPEIIVTTSTTEPVASAQ